jgi:hypothetical protein
VIRISFEEDLKDADEILKDDIAIIDGLVEHYQKTKSASQLLEIAKQADSLADLYYEALEAFSPRFSQYKLMASEYYDKLSGEIHIPNAKVMSILLCVLAGKPETAQKKLELLQIKSTHKKNSQKSEVDEVLLALIELIVNHDIEHAMKKLRNQKSLMDENLYKYIRKTLDYLVKM